MEPKCQYFGNCGGCALQKISYPEQVEGKRLAVSKAIDFPDVKAFFSEPYNYRNRMDMLFFSGGLGLRRKNDWSAVVDIEQCPIASLEVNQLISEIRSFFRDIDAFDLKRHTGTYRYTVIRATSSTSSVSFVLSDSSSRLKEAVEKIKEFASATTAKNVLITYSPPETDESISADFFVVKGNENLKENLLGCSFQFSAQGFFQNNTAMAAKMQEYCNGLIRSYDTKHAHLLDLYGGVGSFGIVNSPLFKTVTIVEGDKHCIDSAQLNISENKVKNARAVLMDAAQLKKLELGSPLFVVTDPPRSGMNPKTIEELKQLSPEVIIYISCNVEQLGKDVKKFRKYKIKSAAMFDLFPQTRHSEAIVELVKVQQ